VQYYVSIVYLDCSFLHVENLHIAATSYVLILSGEPGLEKN